MGKRYGFARFFNIRDYRSFAIRLDNIIIGCHKIFVNIRHFHRGKYEKKQVRVGDREFVHGNQSLGKGQEGVSVTEERGLSYADKVRCKVQSESMPAFMVKEETLKEMEVTHVGEVRSPGDTYSIQAALYNEGIFSLKAIPMGANLVLLVDKEKGAYDSAVSDFRDWFEHKFVKVSRWNQKMLDKERVCWIRCLGIPPHAWTPEFFDFLSNFVGKFMGASPSTCSLETLDVAFLKIRTVHSDLINLNVDVLINDVLFSIRLLEVFDGIGLQDKVEKDSVCEDDSTEEDFYVPETGDVWQEGMFEFLREEIEEEEASFDRPTARVAVNEERDDNAIIAPSVPNSNSFNDKGEFSHNSEVQDTFEKQATKHSPLNNSEIEAQIENREAEVDHVPMMLVTDSDEMQMPLENHIMSSHIAGASAPTMTVPGIVIGGLVGVFTAYEYAYLASYSRLTGLMENDEEVAKYNKK